MITHGLAGTYRKGCRCEPCRHAHAERARRETTARATRTPPADAHGKAATYSNWLCRCEPCTTAHSTYLRDRRQQARGSIMTTPITSLHQHGLTRHQTTPLRDAGYDTAEAVAELVDQHRATAATSTLAQLPGMGPSRVALVSDAIDSWRPR